MCIVDLKVEHGKGEKHPDLLVGNKAASMPLVAMAMAVA
jgi:hypothetical protein